MPSELPTEIAANSDPADQPSGENRDADGAAESGDRDDRSYEQRVMDRLVPHIDVGDADRLDSHRADGGPQTDAEADTDAELADALEEIDDDLLTAFIRIVVSIKAGILLISIGLLIIGFQGLLAVGGGFIAVGCLAFAHAVQRYWSHKQTRQRVGSG